MAVEQLVWAYCEGTVFSFERAQVHSPSVFGGPMEVELSGIEHGPKAASLDRSTGNDRHSRDAWRYPPHLWHVL